MTETTDKSTPDRPGEVLAVATLDGPAITRADRFIHVSLAMLLEFGPIGSTDLELGTQGHGLGVVRYRQVRQMGEQVYLYERAS